MDEDEAGLGKVVVNRAMSLDGFVAGPQHEMGWVVERLGPDLFPELEAATGAMLVGRTTYEVARRMAPEDTGYDGGRQHVLTHRVPDEPDPGVTFLTCGLAEAVGIARSAAGGKDLEVLGSDLAGQCLRQGLVDEVNVYVLPVLLGDGVRVTIPGLGPIDLEPLGSRSAGAVTLLRFRVVAGARGGAEAPPRPGPG